MKAISPVLLSLAGCLMLLSQTKSSQPAYKGLRLRGIEQNLSDEIVRAQKSVLVQRDAVRKATPAEAPAAQKALKDAQAKAADLSKQALPPAAVVTPVDATDQAALMSAASTLYNNVAPLADSAARVQAGFIWASLVLGFISSVLASFNWNRTAAIFSAAVVLASGAPNIYPVNQKAVYYQTLANHAKSLNSALALAPQLTLAEYNNDVRYETALENAIAFPGLSEGDPTEGLLDALDAARIPAQ